MLPESIELLALAALALAIALVFMPDRSPRRRLALQGGAGLAGTAAVAAVPTFDLALLVPLLVFGATAFAISGTAAIRTQPRPAAFEVPAAALAGRVSELLRTATVPEQYRTLFNLRGLEVAAAGGRPVLWLGALIALGFAVTR